MRHRKKGKKLSRTDSHRKATLNNLFTNLILHESIKTTADKAKALKRFADKKISQAKKADLERKREFKRIMYKEEAYYKLFDSIVPQYEDREGGFVRVIKMPIGRRGDGTIESIVELV